MSDAPNTVDILLTGNLLPNADIDQAAATFANAVNISLEEARDLIAGGKPTLLKRGLPLEKGLAATSRLASLGIEAVTRPSATPSKPTEPPAPEPAETTCPKCGHQQAGGEECENCGIIFHKWAEREKRREQEAAPEPEVAPAPDNTVTQPDPDSPPAQLPPQPAQETPPAQPGGPAPAFAAPPGAHAGNAYNPYSQGGGMTFGQAIATCFSKYADFSGRASRPEFWFFILFDIITYFCTLLLVGMDNFGLLFLLRLPFMLPEISVTVRRLHDMNQSGWLVLIAFIPFLGVLVLLIMASQPGTAGPNRFGEPEGAFGNASAPPFTSAPYGPAIPPSAQPVPGNFAFPPQSGGDTRTGEENGATPPNEELPPACVNSIGMEFTLVPAGSFLMGSPAGNFRSEERPDHQVTITRPFYLGKYPVTQAQWQAIMGMNPSKFQGLSNPVERVSWNDAQQFIAFLNAREGHNLYRLPTEAEWEYACRAGTTSKFFFGDDVALLDRYAWHVRNAGSPRPVGQKEPNPWGFYDMCGNVGEWVWDWYHAQTYSVSPPLDPYGPVMGTTRVWRGGSYYNDPPSHCRSASRFDARPGKREPHIGFRLAMMVDAAVANRFRSQPGVAPQSVSAPPPPDNRLAQSVPEPKPAPVEPPQPATQPTTQQGQGAKPVFDLAAIKERLGRLQKAAFDHPAMKKVLEDRRRKTVCAIAAAVLGLVVVLALSGMFNRELSKSKDAEQAKALAACKEYKFASPVANCQGFVVPLLAFASCRITRFSLSFTV